MLQYAGSQRAGTGLSDTTTGEIIQELAASILPETNCRSHPGFGQKCMREVDTIGNTSESGWLLLQPWREEKGSSLILLGSMAGCEYLTERQTMGEKHPCLLK